MKTPKDMIYGSIHQTKTSGHLKILKYHSSVSVDVIFPDTGYSTTCQSSNIRSGYVKDKYLPAICGVGFLGGDYYQSGDKGIELKCYDSWCNMLKRCYSDDYHSKFPTYKDCEVCEEWQNFQNFAEWFYDNYPMDGAEYHLDKDLKVAGNNIYSPENCCFITPHENVMEMNHRVNMFITVFTSPEGEDYTVSNISQFCRDNGLSQADMSRLVTGVQRSYKGWKLKQVIK